MTNLYTSIINWIAANPEDAFTFAVVIIYLQWMFPFMKKMNML